MVVGMVSLLVACQSVTSRSARDDRAGPGTLSAAAAGTDRRVDSHRVRPRPDNTRQGPLGEAGETQSPLTDRNGIPDGQPLSTALMVGAVGPEPDLWQRLRSDFQFVQCEPADTMRASLRGFTAHPKAFSRLFEDAAPHIDYVARRLKEAGVPAEFAFLPMVESRYLHRPRQAGSRGPAGPWQLMPHTARAMGLRVDRSRDQRMELAPSTDAAIRLLKSLHRQFDDWTLVNLAYNAGDGRVRGALRRAGGWHGDPYALSLSPITRAHFSRLRALVCICTTPDRYGLILPARSGPASASPLVAAASRITEPQVASSTLATHVVARGDSLWILARRYGVKLENLRRWNALEARAMLHPGQVLRLRAP